MVASWWNPILYPAIGKKRSVHRWNDIFVCRWWWSKKFDWNFFSVFFLFFSFLSHEQWLVRISCIFLKCNAQLETQTHWLMNGYCFCYPFGRMWEKKKTRSPHSYNEIRIDSITEHNNNNDNKKVLFAHLNNVKPNREDLINYNVISSFFCSLFVEFNETNEII